VQKRAWANCVKGVDVWTEEAGDEIEFWSATGTRTIEPVVIWNTFHRTIGGQLGIVLGGDAAAINALAASKSPWGVLLVPRTTPFTSDLAPKGGIESLWKFDSFFQWIGYNLSVGFISGEFPRIGA